MNSSTPKPIASMAHLRGLAQLGFDATQGVVGVVEQLHRTISSATHPLAKSRASRTAGLTGAVYGTVRGTTGLIGRGVDLSLRLLETRLPGGHASPQREAVLAAVNGIWGDHLAATGNPLAIPMRLRMNGHALPLSKAGLQHALPGATGRVAVLVHGLCMNDLQWRRNGHHHGDVLSQELGCTVLALHYNTGLSIADNGARFAELLNELVAAWPVPVDELVLVGHSMGGLVARSAVAHADAQDPALPWRTQLAHLVCLGSPHEGSRLERGGRLIDTGLELSPYLAPFARLGKTRSQGINDLHDGSIRAPLPSHVKVGLVAATAAAAPKGIRHALLGDGLVTVASAWGEHADKARALQLPASRKRLVTQANHWDLLSHPQVADALRDWLR
jgi:pimeloyl-ACP methyl ester carboxylesterase